MTHPSASVSGRAWKPNGLFFRHALRSMSRRLRASPPASAISAVQPRHAGGSLPTEGGSLTGGVPGDQQVGAGQAEVCRLAAAATVGNRSSNLPPPHGCARLETDSPTAGVARVD